ELNPQTVQLAPLIDEVVGTARQLAEQNKNRLLVEAQEKLGALTVDPMRLRQILLNLPPAVAPPAAQRPASSDWHDDRHCPRWIGFRSRDPRKSRQSGSARGEMQKITAGKFQCPQSRGNHGC